MNYLPVRRSTGVALAVVAVLAVVTRLVVLREGDRKESDSAPFLPEDVARWFMPSSSGHEPGREAGDLSIRAYRTRTLSGVRDDNDGTWAQRNRITAALRFMHNLDQVFPPELFDRHPEFFPLEAGRRIRPPTGSKWWNPDIGRKDVAAFAADVARRFFTDYPDQDSFSLGTNDGLIYGESTEVLDLTTPVQWFRERPDYSNLVFAFMNRVAAELARTHPDKYLGALAYYWSENTPNFTIHPQVAIYLTADRSQGYDSAFWAEEKALQRRWAAQVLEYSPTIGDNLAIPRKAFDKSGPSPAKGGTTADNLKASFSSLRGLNSVSEVGNVQRRLGLYDYTHSPGFLIPRLHTQLIAETMREARRLGFTDYMAEMNVNWGLDGPQPWLMAQLLQDPEQPERRLLAEYYRRYFRESAFLMQRFFIRCEQQWMNQKGRPYWLKHFRNESQAAIFPSVVCDELRETLEQARQRAKTDLVRRRVQQVSDAFGVTERFTEMQEARDALNRRVLHETMEGPDVLPALMAFRRARADFSTYTQTLRREHPLLIARFELDDYLRHDPTANALARMADWPQVGAKGANSGPIAFGVETDADELHRLWLQMRELERSGADIVLNGSMAGPVKPGRRIAGLTYGVALPAPWQSRVEPAQFHAADLKPDEPGVLRISGSKDVQVYQWIEIKQLSFLRARVEIRGRVSVSGVAMLTLGWLDASHRHLGTTVMRLPEGEWPDWVTLVQTGTAPAGAAFVGIGIRIQHQLKEDWVEVKDFRLKAINDRR